MYDMHVPPEDDEHEMQKTQAPSQQIHDVLRRRVEREGAVRGKRKPVRLEA